MKVKKSFKVQKFVSLFEEGPSSSWLFLDVGFNNYLCSPHCIRSRHMSLLVENCSYMMELTYYSSNNRNYHNICHPLYLMSPLIIDEKVV